MIGALGVLAKYSVLAMPASVGLFLLLSPRHRRQLTPGLLDDGGRVRRARHGADRLLERATGLGGAGQLADRVGLSGRATWGSLWPVLGFLGGELAVLGGIWWIAGLAALKGAVGDVLPARRRSEPGGDTDRSSTADRPRLDRDGALYLLCLWGVLVRLPGGQLPGGTEANWMAPGYVAVVVLIGWRMARIFAVGGARARVYGAAWCVAIVAVVAIHHTDWFYPIVARYVPAPSGRWAAPLRSGSDRPAAGPPGARPGRRRGQRPPGTG